MAGKVAKWSSKLVLSSVRLAYGGKGVPITHVFKTTKPLPVGRLTRTRTVLREVAHELKAAFRVS